MPFFKSDKHRAEEDFLPVTSRPPVKRQLGYYVANLQGIGSRERQEDSFAVANAFDVALIREKGLFFTVCDGMGGMKDGKLASETAVRSLRQSFLEMDRNYNMAVQLKQSVFQASSQVEALIGGDGGSTVVAGILYQAGLYYASVGDSLFYLLREGKLIRLNTEHNLLHQRYLEAIQEGEMDPLSFQGMPEAGALTGFLGMTGLDLVDGSVRPLPMNDGDVLLACSDGVGVLSPREITEALGRPCVEDMCAELEAGIIRHQISNQDNYTAIVIKCVM